MGAPALRRRPTLSGVMSSIRATRFAGVRGRSPAIALVRNIMSFGRVNYWASSARRNCREACCSFVEIGLATVKSLSLVSFLDRLCSHHQSPRGN